MKAEVIFEITPPVECTKEQFEEWIKYRLGIRDEIKLSNPLHEYDLDLSANGNNYCSISIHQVTMRTKVKSKRWSSLHFVRTLLAAVASNIKARYTAKKFDIWKECQDNNRKSDCWIAGYWIASDGKLYYGHPLLIFFESAQNDWWLLRNNR